jgi:peptide/nickel transport system permease protein
MWRFLLRRLLLAVPTLLGISLITFALVHLAPGDPVSSGELSPGSKRDLEASRRLFFLDLPLFYNGSPRGLEERTSRLIRAYANAGAADRDRTLRALRRCGTVCLPALAAARADAKRPGRVERAIAAIQLDHPDLVRGAADLPRDRWLSRALSMIAPEALAGLGSGLGREPEARRRLEAIGSAALPTAMRVLLDGRGAARRSASTVVCKLTGIEVPIHADQPDEEGQRALAFWSEWWFQHRRDYVRYSWWERLHGRITETRYAKWLARMVTFRFGHSTHDGRPVSEKLAEALPITLVLSLAAMLLAYLIAVPLGVHAAVRQGTWQERGITVTLFLLYSLPSFWVAMVLILLFGGVGLLDWFPIYGLHSPGLEGATGWTWFTDRIHHLVLPVGCLTYGSLAVISRYQRSAMLEVIRQDYIRTARAKGLSERAVIFKHALRNALLPTITLIGLQFPYLIGGSVIIERIFNIPGMGLMTFQAFLNRDYPVIMAVSVLSAVMTLLGLILADLFYAVVDPRISLEERR